MPKGTGCQIGTNVNLSSDTLLGNNVTICNNVTIYPKVSIGDGCRILDGTVIGRLPIAAGTTNRPLLQEYRPVTIGTGSVIGCNVVLYTGITVGRHVLIADLASVREGCQISDSAVIGRGVMVLYDVEIGTRSRVQDQAHIVGNTIIESDVFVGMGVMTANDNDIYLTRFGIQPLDWRGPIIRRFAVIGINATILPGVEIGVGVLVASGSVVTRDVPSWTVVAGVPAQYLRDIPQEWRSKLPSL